MAQDLLHNIQEQLNANRPFVVYRKPNEVTVRAVFQKDDELHELDNLNQSGFVFAPFDNAKKSILIHCDQYLEGILPEVKLDDTVLSSSSVSVEKGHIQLVQKGVDEILRSDLEKVVLSRVEAVPLVETPPLALFQRLLGTYKTAMVYYWHHPKVGTWLGATPETLLYVSGDDFSTMALAGTQKFEGSMSVTWGAKEQEEQQIVTDSIVKHFQSYLETVSTSETKTAKAGNLLHLKTDIRGMGLQSQYTLNDLVNALHPTPAVCGFPKEKAKQFILDNEGYDRGFYTGYLGELHMNGVSDLYVNLRCMKFENGVAHVYVGGGITGDSNPVDEWQETVNKSATMKAVLTN